MDGEDGLFGTMEPSCNIETVKDGRGGIFTWLPKKDVEGVELVYSTPGLGIDNVTNDFTEYFLMIDGSGVMIFNENSREYIYHLSRGDCAYSTPGVSHSFYAITPSVFVRMNSGTGEPRINSEEQGRFGRIEPECSLETVVKKMGGNFKWQPLKPIKEFNLLYFTPGASRGDHFHPEFTEYFLVGSGSGKMVYKNPGNPLEKERVYHMSRGNFVYTTPGIAHSFHAIDPAITIAMLSKPWNECEKPIIHCDVSRHLEKKLEEKDKGIGEK